MYKFTWIDENEGSDDKVEIVVTEGADLYTLLQGVERFMWATGFRLSGSIEVVDNEDQ
jgi:hypothetical protein